MKTRNRNELCQLYLTTHYYYSKLLSHNVELSDSGLSLFDEVNKNARRSLILASHEFKIGQDVAKNGNIDGILDSMIILRDACESLGLSS
jgi:hypothetical protein